MRIHMKTSERGVGMVEFALFLTLLVPLLLGTFVFGFKLIRNIEMIQITRDLAHMYVRGVNFRNAGPQQNAQTMAAEYALTSTGSSLVVLSSIRLVTQADCLAANGLILGLLPCTNLNKLVFIEQLTLGNPSAGASAFGTPPLEGDKTVSVYNLANTASAQATGFSTVMSLNSGEVAHVVEMINLTPELNIPGLSGSTQVYARSIF